MNDKYLSKDGIEEKYYHRNELIKCLRNIGTIAGLGYAVLKVGTNLREMIAGGVLGVGSYLTGRYLHKRNEAKKEKALKNLEMVFEGERI
jgi:hypothetical protein